MVESRDKSEGAEINLSKSVRGQDGEAQKRKENIFPEKISPIRQPMQQNKKLEYKADARLFPRNKRV